MEWARDVSPRFPLVTPGVWELPFRSSDLVCMECLKMIKPMVVSFCSVGGWCYSGWLVWNLRALAKFQGSEMYPGLFQDFMNGYIKP